MRLGSIRKSLIAIASVLVFLVMGSVFLVCFQEDPAIQIELVPQKLTKEMKVKMIESSLAKIIHFESALSPWADQVEAEEIQSNLLHPEGKITDKRTECVPAASGYTQEEADSIFDPYAEFIDCIEETPVTVKLDKQNLLKVCDEMEFVLGKPPSEERFGRLPYEISWTQMTAPGVETKDREFAFIKCGDRREAVVIFKKNKEAEYKAGRIRENNMKLAGLEATPRPLTVFMLIFDSLSRSHMYRNFPKTMKFLNDSVGKGSHKEDFVMYDFLLNHAHGENTIPNMIPYLFGYSFPYQKIRIGNHSHLDPKDTEFFVQIQKDSIWKQFENMGFVTMFGFDIIWDFLVPAVGRVIKTDHVFTNFWKASSKVFGTDNYINQHSCFGSYNSHKYMFDYVQSFLTEYKGQNRFGYSHITTAHEKSGTIIRTVDEDLLEFLIILLKFYSEIDEDIVFILGGDHGKHVSETDIIKPGFIENMTPGQIVIANKPLIQRLEADEVLRHNSQKLVSRPDWHLTLQHLSLAPYGKLDKNSRLYQNWKKASETDHVVSVLLEKIPNSRTCEDVNIEDYFCVCLPYHELSEQEYESNKIILKAIQFTIESINRSQKNLLCRKVKFLSVTYAAVRDIAPDYKLYRIRANIVEHPDVVFESFAAVYPAIAAEKYRKADESLPFVKFYNQDDDRTVEIQLLKFVRIDEYVGYNEEFAIVIDEKPSFCIPLWPEEISYDELKNKKLTKVLETLKDDLVLRLAEDYMSCFDACKEYDQVCQDWGILLLSNQLILFSDWNDDKEVTLHTGDSTITIDYFSMSHDSGEYLGLSNSTIFYPSTSFSCSSLPSSSISLICPCKK